MNVKPSERWYKWAKEKGYMGTLSDFIEEVVEEFFRRYGLILLVDP